jgi:hypothetical protein
MSGISNANVMDRLLEPISRSLNPDNARTIAEMEAAPEDQRRILELAEKCNQGDLTPDERNEYETYVHVGNFMGILQVKARLFLKQHPPVNVS